MTVAIFWDNRGLPLPFVVKLCEDCEGRPEPEVTRCLCSTLGPLSALDVTGALVFEAPVDFRRRSNERSEKLIPGPWLWPPEDEGR